MMPIVQSVPLLEDLLERWSAAIGPDFDGYRGHCYRVLNFYTAQTPNSPGCPEKIVIAVAFHDLGIWVHRTFDYLAPSADLASSYLMHEGKGDWIEETRLLICHHHRIRPIPGAADSSAELFRRADWIDVSGGLVRFGVPLQTVRDAYAIWPSAGFHRNLIRLSWDRFKRYPLSPLPMLILTDPKASAGSSGS